MAKVVTAIENEFAPSYTRIHSYDLGIEDGMMKPRVNIGSIESGWPFKPGFVPAVCNSYLDIRLVPGESPLDAQRELGQFLANFEEREGIPVMQEIYSVKGPSSETSASSYLVAACKNSYEKVAKVKHMPGSPGKQSFGDDSLVTRRFGIPSVTWGPGGQLPEYAGAAAASGGDGEFIRMVDVLTACKMYAAVALDICSRTRDEVRS
jgi:acetylornithine deacetylase/succinyl-diaminopimelate desuccinylase-like protein